MPDTYQDLYTDEYKRRRQRALMAGGDLSVADTDRSWSPSGHAAGVAASTRLTSQYRQRYKRQSMDITPQQVVDVLVAAGVEQWVLMGLHGYAGYMPDPRATQDVDVLVPYRQKRRAMRAICEAWPGLEMRESSQVVRFADPGDCDAAGRPKVVVDLMLPWGMFQNSILDSCVVVDQATQHRLPTLEAALVSKYAAMVSSHREWDRKEYDAGDFRQIVRANYDRLDRDQLRVLGTQVWDGGGDEVLKFVEIAMQNQPFPI
jgi:hypothetical protein